MAWTIPIPGITEWPRFLCSKPDVRVPSAADADEAKGDYVTIADLKSSSRVRFWVPPQIMKEFLP